MAPVLSAPRRTAGPLLLLLGLTACGADTVHDTSAALTTTAEPEPQATTSPAPTTTGAGDESTGDATTTTTTTTTESSSSTTSTASTTTTDPGSTSTTDEPATTEPADEPPADPCAAQDEPPPPVGAPSDTNDDPAFIHVYVNNVENLKLADESCAGDWTDLIYYMKTIKPAPDVFLVQQVSDTAQLNLLVDRMTDELPDSYEGIIADGDPWTQGSPCGKEKAKQTNAIIFRKGRFSQVGDKHVWQAWANKNDACVRNSQARTRIVMARLHDEVADRHVTVASVHWSTFQGSGPDPACAEKNIAEVDTKVHKPGFGGDLVIFGGDFNESDRTEQGDFRKWYRQANGDDDGTLNYRDPVYRACQSEGSLLKCLDDQWTIASGRRIDMVFSQDRHGCRTRTRRAHTIEYNEADAAAEDITGSDNGSLNYSEHRGIRAEFYY